MSDFEIKIPNFNVNDPKAVIEELEIKNLTAVKKGELLFSIATAKAVEDFFSPKDGYFVSKIEIGKEYAIGETIAYICETIDEGKNRLVLILSKINETPPEIKATKKAQRIAQEKNIDLKLLMKEGIITEKDVEEFIQKNK